MALLERIAVPSAGGQVAWSMQPALAAHWPAGESWPLDRWLHEGVARVHKQSPQRTIYRVDLPGISFFLKRHHLPDTTTWLRQCLRAPKARREYDALVEIHRRGIPAPEPLGWGFVPGRLGVGESFLLTRTLDDVVSLADHLLSHRDMTPESRHCLTRDLAQFLARLHDAGVLHLDLHPGNLLLSCTTDGFRFFLVDLDAVRLGRCLAQRDSEANLTMLNAWFLARSDRSDRLRFLRSYVQTRGWVDLPRDRTGPRELFHIARRLEVRTWDYLHAFAAERDERCLRDNRYYRRLRSASCTGHATRSLDGEWVRRLLDDPDALFGEPGVRILKNSPSSTVAVVRATVKGVERDVILKRFLVTRRSDPWVALLRPTSAQRSWVMGQGFLERGLPTARPLAVVHRHRAGLPREAYLVTEKLDHVEELNVYVDRVTRLPRLEARRRLRRQLERVARAVRDLHDRNLSHRDLKAANLLVTSVVTEDTAEGAALPICSISIAPLPERTTNLWFIDLVGVRLYTRLGKRRKVQNLARLNASFLDQPTLTRADRLRFLAIYLGWGIHGRGNWKSWWRDIVAATARKIERNRRNGRVLA